MERELWFVALSIVGLAILVGLHHRLLSFLERRGDAGIFLTIDDRHTILTSQAGGYQAASRNVVLVSQDKRIFFDQDAAGSCAGTSNMRGELKELELVRDYDQIIRLFPDFWTRYIAKFIAGNKKKIGLSVFAIPTIRVQLNITSAELGKKMVIDLEETDHKLKNRVFRIAAVTSSAHTGAPLHE